MPGVCRRTWGYLSPSRGWRSVQMSQCPPLCRAGAVPRQRPGSPHGAVALAAALAVPPAASTRHRAAALEGCAQQQEELRHFRVTLGTAQGDLPYIYLPGIVPSRDINSRFQCSAFFLSPPRPSWQHNYQPQSIIFLIKMLRVKQSHK